MNMNAEPPAPPGSDVINIISAVLANLTQLASLGLDATVGYRAQAERAGFSPTAAEAMAEEFHRHLLEWQFRQFTGTQK